MQHTFLGIFYKKKKVPRVLFSLQLCQYFLSLVFLMTNILICVRISLTVILICISMMITDVDQFVSASWPFVCFLWEKNVCLVLLSIFKLDRKGTLVHCWWQGKTVQSVIMRNTMEIL